MIALPPDWSALASSTTRREEVLITVKAYPNPSRKYIETVCVAGVTRGGQWIRLYPVPYRSLAHNQQFRTFDWVHVGVRKSRDRRPESHHVDEDTVEVLDHLGTRDHWKARSELLLPLASPSLEYLREQQQLFGTSLGLIRPKAVKRLVIRPDAAHWSAADLAKLRQRTLMDGFRQDGTLDAIKELEKIPYHFLYEFDCDDPRCNGHKLSIISWEVMQSYRNWRQKNPKEWEVKFRQMYEQKLPGPNHDLHFFVGTVSSHPQEWTIIGLFYPPALSKPSTRAQPIPVQQRLF